VEQPVVAQRTKAIPFTKMHGLGNDFVVVDAVADVDLLEREDWCSVAQQMCDRATGVGADGMLIVSRGRSGGRNDFVMRVINADGSEPEMCGNGLRCAARLCVEKGYAGDGVLMIETAGVMRAAEATRDGHAWAITVDMGAPGFGATAVAGDAELLQACGPHEYELEVEGKPHRVVLVSTGNPHAVMHLKGVGQRDLLSDGTLIRLGAAIEHHDAFANGINAQFVHVVDKSHVNLRTWERGVGITRACGSGACAAAAACMASKHTGRDVTVHMTGGDLRVVWREGDDHMLMTGPAERVFDGVWSVQTG